MDERGVGDFGFDKEIGNGEGPARILLATDGSRGSELAARSAAEFSRNFGSSLHLVHVTAVSRLSSGVDVDEGDSLTIYEEDAGQARILLEEQAERLKEAGAAVEKAELKTGEPDAEIVTLAKEIGADLVILGSRGAGAFKRSPMGSVSESVVRHAHCPVLVAREQEPTDDGKKA